MTTPAGASGGEGYTSSPTQPLQFNSAPAGGLSSRRRPRVDSSTASSSNAHDAGSSSTTSHASTASSRLPSSSALNHGSSNPATPRSALSSIPPPASPMHQPLSLADALARSQGDITRALDEVLAERNKHCLEAAKLSNENIRIWNLMGKIRKENESLKARLMGSNNNGGGSSAWSNSGSSVEGGATTPLSTSTMGTPQRSVTSPLAAAGAANAPPSSRNRLPSADAAVAATPTAALAAPAASSSMASPRRAPLPPPLLPTSQSHSPYAAQATSSSSAAGTPQPPPAVFTSSASVPNELSNDSSILDLTEQAPLPPNEAAQTPLSPGARNVMAQRERAKALQQQQARAGPSSAGMAMARSLSSGLAGVGSSSQQQQQHSYRPSEDYTAVDSSTIGGGASDDDAFSKGASSSSATPTKSALGLVRQPRGSVGSVDTVDSDDVPARPVRRKNFGADAPPALRPRPSRLEPRDATTSPRKGKGGGGGGDDDDDAGGSGISLSQALMQLANSTPPGGSPNLSQPQPRLDNRLLKHANVRVAGSNLRHDERRREIPTFYLAVDLTDVALSNPTALPLDAPTSWRIEKSMNDVLGLDAKLRHRGGKAVAKKIGAVPLPEKQLFKDHAPSKVDMRKGMLEAWLLNLLAVQLPDKDDVCTFLCTDVVVSPRGGGRNGRGKDGWLTKKGQNLGRWVTRYYALDGPRLDYFESKEGGALLGSIHIRGAQIGRQQRAAQSDMDENSYRHAFLILEKKKGVAPGAMGPNGEAQQPNERIDAGGAPVPDQLVRHVLCAESDDERDEWVDALVKTIAEIERSEGGGATGGGAGATTVVPTMSTSTSGASAKATPAPALPPSGSASSSAPAPSATKTKRSNSLSRRLNKSRDGGAAAAAAAAAVASDDGPASPSSSPAVGGSADADPAALSSPSLKDRGVRPAISAPMNGTPIPTGYKFGARDEDTSRPGPVPTGSLSHSNSSSSQQHYQTTSQQQQAAQQAGQAAAAQQPSSDRRRFWHRFGGGGVGSSGTTGDLAGLAKGSSSSSSSHNAGTTSGPVFGVPLTDAIAISSVGSGLLLPSVVFRCIEYLEKRQAIQEEGIYRMSGSTADVKALRDRFNNEGDVDLLAGGGDKDDDAPHHDPHAVAGLLKTFLRELPTSVLTRELHLDFMRVNDVADWKQRVRDLGHLVSALPLANYSLLRTLCAHLIKVISYQDVNKMTMRNVGIVFSPTLGIPAGVFALFLTSFDYCFWTDAKGEPRPRDPTMEDDQDGEGGEGGGAGGGAAQPSSAAGAGGEGASAAGGAGASLPPPSPAAADQRGSTDTPSGTSRSNSASGSGSGSGSGSASGSSSYGYGFPPGAVPPHPYRASSIGYRSTPNAAQAAAIAANAAQAAAAGAGQQPQPQPQSQPGRWQQRSNRNSLNYSEEDARRLLGGVPLGTHRLRRTNPEDEGSYDAEEDFMGGPTVAAGGGGGGLSAPPSANSSRRPSPAGLQGGGGEHPTAAQTATSNTNASPGRWTQVGAS